MPTKEDILNQVRLLNTYRTNLSHFVTQRAMHGIANCPVVVIHGIREAQENIKVIKNTLREWGVDFEDLPYEEENGQSISVMASNINYKKLSPLAVEVLDNLTDSRVKERWDIYRNSFYRATYDYYRSSVDLNLQTFNSVIDRLDKAVDTMNGLIFHDMENIRTGMVEHYRYAIFSDTRDLRILWIGKELLIKHKDLFIDDIIKFEKAFIREYRTRLVDAFADRMTDLNPNSQSDKEMIGMILSTLYTVLDYRIQT